MNKKSNMAEKLFLMQKLQAAFPSVTKSRCFSQGAGCHPHSQVKMGLFLEFVGEGSFAQPFAP